MSTFGDRLRQLRKQFGISQQQLADQITMSKSSVNMYERGEREPGIDTLRALSDYFLVDIDYLLGKTVTPRSAEAMPALDKIPGISLPRMKKIPLLGKTACGEPIFSPELDDGYALLGEGFSADFALEARGDSMIQAGIHDGDIVYFLAQPQVDNGQIAAVFIGEEVTLKRVYYYREKNKLVLQPENPSYEPLVYVGQELSSIRIIGRAVAHLRRL